MTSQYVPYLDDELITLLSSGDQRPPWFLLMLEIDRDDRFRLRLHAVSFGGKKRDHEVPLASERSNDIGVCRVQVSTLAGEVVTNVDLPFAAIRQDLKQHVQEMTGVPIAEQRLFLGCEELIASNVFAAGKEELWKKSFNKDCLTVTLVRDSALWKEKFCDAGRACLFDPPVVQFGRRSMPMCGYALWRDTDTEGMDATWQLVKVCPETSTLRQQSMTNSRFGSVHMMLQDCMKVKSFVMLDHTWKGEADMTEAVLTRTEE